MLGYYSNKMIANHFDFAENDDVNEAAKVVES